MPTYVYACKDCGHGFEAVQSFTDDSLSTCPECAGRLRKVFSSVGVVFKGSGFYRNDAREKSGANRSSASDSEAKPSDKEPSSTSEGRTDADGAKKGPDSPPAETASNDSAGSTTPRTTNANPPSSARPTNESRSEGKSPKTPARTGSH